MVNIVEHTEEIRAAAREIDESSAAVVEAIDGCKRRILVAFTRDERTAKHWNRTAKAFSDLTRFALQAIPGAGGYMSLMFKVMQDPIKGTYEVSRTSFTGSDGST